MRILLTRPYMINSEDGQLLQVLGASVSIKARSEQTGGVFNLFEVRCPPGFATPLHIHHTEDVAVYVLEGLLTVFWGSERREGRVDSYFFQPRGTPHGFRVEGGTPARILYGTMPAGLDRFLFEYQSPTSIPEAGTAAARYKIELLGPLPK